ncbi:MAG: hypothetical protein RLZ71_641 [Actinomycetota bacterium]|jgi:glycerol uptake facilitator-like aquaporin
MVAEFLGVTLFLTAIIGAASYFGTNDANVLHAPALAITLGLMILLTGGVSGGHLNPAVSLYFLSKKAISGVEFLGYVVAQLAGAAFGVYLGNLMQGYTAAGFSTAPKNISTAVQISAFVGEVVATAGLVWIIIHLVNSKLGNLIPVAVAAWVLAASQFTPTGAQANPAVTFGLMFNGSLTVSYGLLLILAEVLGVLVALVVTMALTSGNAKKKAAAKKK